MLRVNSEIKFHCSRCGQKLVIEAAGAGKTADCPRCQGPLKIPAAELLLSALNDDVERLHSSVTERVRAQRRPSDAERLCAEFLETTLSAGRLEQELADAELELTALRERLAAPKPEALRREGEYQQLHAEWRRADDERLLLQTSLITSQQQLAAVETLLTLRERDVEDLRARLGGAEAEGASGRAEAAALQCEVAALRAELADKEAAVREALAQLSQARKDVRRVEADRESSEAECRRLQAEVASLEGDLRASARRREFVKLREAVDQADAERAGMAAKLAETQAEMERLATRERERCAEVERLRRERRAAERQAEQAFETEGRVHRANEILRGILTRQTIELEARYRDLLRFRRSQVGLKMLRVVFAITIASVVGLALKVLPAVAMEW